MSVSQIDFIKGVLDMTMSPRYIKKMTDIVVVVCNLDSIIPIEINIILKSLSIIFMMKII